MNSNPKESINCAWLFPRQEKPNEIKIEFSSFKFPPQLRRERNMKETGEPCPPLLPHRNEK